MRPILEAMDNAIISILFSLVCIFAQRVGSGTHFGVSDEAVVVCVCVCVCVGAKCNAIIGILFSLNRTLSPKAMFVVLRDFPSQDYFHCT